MCSSCVSGGGFGEFCSVRCAACVLSRSPHWGLGLGLTVFQDYPSPNTIQSPATAEASPQLVHADMLLLIQGLWELTGGVC